MKSTVTKKFFEVLRDLGYKKDVDFTYHINDMMFKFKESGSEIQLLGLAYDPSDPQQLWLGGYEFTGGWIDESNEVDKRVIDTLYTRLGRVGNAIKVDGKTKVVIPVKVLQTFNPDQNHVYTKFWIPYKNRKQETSLFVRAYATDNYDEDHPYVQSLLLMDEGPKKDRLLRGSFEYSSSVNAMAEAESVGKMNEGSCIPKKAHSIKFMSIDVSSSSEDDEDKDLTVYALFDVIPQEGGWIYNCYELDKISHKSPEELISKVKKISVKHSIPNENIVGDGNGIGDHLIKSIHLQGMMNYMAHHAAVKTKVKNYIKTRKGKNILIPKFESTFHRLKDQTVYLMLDRIAKGKMTATFDNQYLMDYLKQELLFYKNETLGLDAKIKVTGKKDFRSEIGRSPDVSDLFHQIILFELIGENIHKPKPKAQRKFINKTKKKRTYV